MGGLVTLFASYNALIYFQGNVVKGSSMSSQALEGEQLYQNHNCASCHQLYGLGGYLGPDLTNVISNKEKGRDYVRAFLNSGSSAMPEFNFNDKEKDAFVAFLRHVDSTGYYPDREAVFGVDGWVSVNYKE